MLVVQQLHHMVIHIQVQAVEVQQLLEHRLVDQPSVMVVQVLRHQLLVRQ